MSAPDDEPRFNEHRMTHEQTKNEESIGWLVKSYRNSWGHSDLLYEDYVIEDHVKDYVSVCISRGAERVQLSRLGPLKLWLGKPVKTRGKSVRVLTQPLESFQ